VAIAGSVGFVGLFVPHLARFVVGSDFRWLIPASAVAGGWLLLVADAIARSLVPPQEVPVGILTAALGTPLFVYLARRG
jgi:iron complex transport system permease protein